MCVCVIIKHSFIWFIRNKDLLLYVYCLLTQDQQARAIDNMSECKTAYRSKTNIDFMLQSFLPKSNCCRVCDRVCLFASGVLELITRSKMSEYK